MAKRLRICPECQALGREITFENGNKLRQHRRSFHQKTNRQKSVERESLAKFRRNAIVALRRETT